MQNLRHEKNTSWFKAPFAILAMNTNDTDKEYGVLCSHGLDDALLVEGCYKGVVEESWIIPLSEDPTGNEGKWKAIKSMAQGYKQESALVVAPNHHAFLLFTGGEIPAHTIMRPIGRWTPCCKEIALDQEGYTKFNGQYFVVV